MRRIALMAAVLCLGTSASISSTGPGTPKERLANLIARAGEAPGEIFKERRQIGEKPGIRFVFEDSTRRYIVHAQSGVPGVQLWWRWKTNTTNQDDEFIADNTASGFVEYGEYGEYLPRWGNRLNVFNSGKWWSPLQLQYPSDRTHLQESYEHILATLENLLNPPQTALVERVN